MNRSKDFLSTEDCSAGDLQLLLDLASQLKRRQVRASLEGKGLGLLFFNPSLRTRTSFQVAMAQLGGHSVVLEVGGGVWDLEVEDGVVMDQGKAEHIREAAPVLARYLDCLAVRSFARGLDWELDRQDPVLSAFARHTPVPVINMESSLWHPCQALADALTWQELGMIQGSKFVLTWAYHPRALPLAVPNSVLMMAAQRGLDVTLLRPPEYGLDPDLMERVRLAAEAGGGQIRETSDPAALEGAQVVYAKSWGSLEAYGRPEQEQTLRRKYSHWQVTRESLAASPAARFMHCLPVRRNVVVSDQVLDSATSVVVDQAENRLHVQKALLAVLLGARIESGGQN